MKKQEARRRRWMRVRIGLLAFLLLGGAGLVLRRAWSLQFHRADSLRQMAESQYLRDLKIAPKRGTVYDRHGAELAVSVNVDSIWANPRELKRAGQDPSAVAQQLTSVLSIDTDRIANRLAKDRYFVWIDRHVTPAEAERVRALKIPGIAMTEEAKRFYPNRQLGAHLLGFANIDGEGIEGLELAYEETLRGASHSVPAIRDRRGDIVFSEQLLDDRAAQGDDIYLTIDKTIQHIAERELELAVRTFEAQAGSVVVMDPLTGEVLAVANYPSFDPNRPGRAAQGHRRNRAITDVFEPGSTVKPFTVAAALAAGTIRPNQSIDCENGAMLVDRYTIHDPHPFEELTPAQILVYSSNIGTSKIGQSLGRRGLFRALRRLGFGAKTDVNLPGEARGILRHPRHWYEMDMATIAFGQGMSVTNMQMAIAVGALANGGRLMRPRLVRRVADAQGKTVEQSHPVVRRRVLPPSVARLVADMMTAVTGPGGTGIEAAIPGHLVAGKTGTAQKADYERGGYAKDRWIASFAGFVPSDHPRAVISVVIDEPVIVHYGGAVAAPVFRRIGAATLRHMGVPEAGSHTAVARRPRQRTPKARSARTARSQRPPRAGSSKAGRPTPDVMGQTLRAALVTLRKASLEVTIRGSGVVVAQDPAPGSVVAPGTTVKIDLVPPAERET